MIGAILAMVLVLDLPPSPDPATLVAQLGSSRYAQRISAEGELARLGRVALPALLAARTSKDAEIRARSAALVDQIGRASLLQSTPVRLDFREVPLAIAVEAIARQSGSRLSIEPAELSELAHRKITLRLNPALPFWDALDALCSVGQVRPSIGELPTRGSLDGGLTLVDGPTRESGPISDSGPFRVRVNSLHYRSEIQLDRSRPVDKGSRLGSEASPDPTGTVDRATKEFFLVLGLLVEPRLSVTANGSIRLDEALDDLGRSLLEPVGPGGFRHEAGYFGLIPSTMVSVPVHLLYPGSSARRIKSLRGSIPVIVSTRKPGPLDVPLSGPVGKPYRGGEDTMVVLQNEPPENDRPATIQLVIRPLDPPTPVRAEGWPSANQAESYQQRLEILDDEGRAIPWFATRVSYDDLETRLTITVDTNGSRAVPAVARLHGIFQAVADVAFDFRDIPIP